MVAVIADLLSIFLFHRPLQGSRLMLSIRALAAKRRRMNVQTMPICSTSTSRRNSLTVPSLGNSPGSDIDIELSDQTQMTPSSTTAAAGQSMTLEKASEEHGLYSSWSHSLSGKLDAPHFARHRRNEDAEGGHAPGEPSSREKQGPYVASDSDGVAVESSWENIQRPAVERNFDGISLSDRNDGSCRCRLGTWIQEWDAV